MFDLLQAKADSIPFFNTFDKLRYWIPRDAVRFYNAHIRLADNTYRVGEATLHSDTIYIFDHNGYQWAEYNPNPAHSR